MALGFEPRALLLLGSALHLSYTCHSVLFSYKVFCLDREKLGFPFWGMGKGNTSLISSYVKLKKKVFWLVGDLTYFTHSLYWKNIMGETFFRIYKEG